MSGETESQPSAWTIDSVKTFLMEVINSKDEAHGSEYSHLRELLAEKGRLYGEIDRRHTERFKELESAIAEARLEATNAISHVDKSTAAALASTDKAITKSETANEKRFEGVNEFRGQLTDQAATFVTRREMEAVVKGLTDKLDVQKERGDKNEGKSLGSAAIWGFVVGAIGLILTIVTLANALTGR